jgi:hypothetical protein
MPQHLPEQQKCRRRKLTSSSSPRPCHALSATPARLHACTLHCTPATRYSSTLYAPPQASFKIRISKKRKGVPGGTFACEGSCEVEGTGVCAPACAPLCPDGYVCMHKKRNSESERTQRGRQVNDGKYASTQRAQQTKASRQSDS